MPEDWDARIKSFEESLDGVSSITNIARAAVAIRCQANVLSADAEEVVLMLDTALWDELDNQISMFMAYMTMEQELETIQPPEGEQQ